MVEIETCQVFVGDFISVVHPQQFAPYVTHVSIPHEDGRLQALPSVETTVIDAPDNIMSDIR